MLLHNSAKAQTPNAGGAGGQAACASRLSTMYGLQGQSLVLDAEGASGLAVLHLASDSVQRASGGGSPQSSALAVGVHLCLSPVWWPSACASGLLSRLGRCLSFNESADGYIRGEGCCAVVVGKDQRQIVGAGDAKDSEDVPPLGYLAGSAMTSGYVGLVAPSNRSRPDVITEALGRAGVDPIDVDCVQANGSGSLLADAVEAANLARIYREGGSREVLAVSSSKTSCGHQMECGGLTSFLEALIAANLGRLPPKLHLRTLNPHVDLSYSPVAFVGESVELRDLSPYIGVSSLGFTGYSVHAIAWGQAPAKTAQQVLPIENAIAFWPGGGGQLTREMRPMRAYTIVGTWSQWQVPDKMEFEGNGTYSFSVTLGDTRQEEFRILLDGDSERVLHPSAHQAGRDTAVFGPSAAADGAGAWRIDGGDAAEEELVGAPGDRYRVQLRIAGRWRMVTWQREPAALPALCSA